ELDDVRALEEGAGAQHDERAPGFDGRAHDALEGRRRHGLDDDLRERGQRIGRDHGDGDALLVEPGTRPVGAGGGHGGEGEPRDAAVKPRGDRAADRAEPGDRDLQGRYSTLMLASTMI